MSHRRVGAAAVLGIALVTTGPGVAAAQEKNAERDPGELVVEPTELTVEVGANASLSAAVKDAAGEPLERPVVFYSRERHSVGVTPAGRVTAYRPGKHVLVAVVPNDPEDTSDEPEGRLQVEIPVTVPPPPVREVAFEALRGHLYAGTEVPLRVRVVDVSGATRTDVPVSFESADHAVARIDPTGLVSLLVPGRVEVRATAEAVTGRATLEIAPDPVTSFEVEADAETARTGDVVRFRALARDARGREVPDYPVLYAVSARPDPRIVAPGAASQIDEEGMFVAERSGVHTVVAVAGPHSATRTVRVTSRDVEQKLVVVDHGAVRDRHTSDLWVWEGPDGRDYALTGTWGADGHAYVWDVTDPANLQIIDMVKVDARTVNDVKVSADGRIAVISREGASNRKNGLVVLDVSKPLEGVRIVSRYDDQLTGGVHNVFLWESHAFALSNGRRYDIINLEDPSRPVRVGRFELDTPGRAIHDVWVVDGVAYSSNWQDGVVAVDVGGGGRGGSLRRPVPLGSHTWPSGWNHAAFPYTSRSTGKRYVFAGDEAFPYGMSPEPGSSPERAAGWIHVIEVDDWERPREVARYEVPGAGSHNLWVEDDVLYVGYYNAGLRVVDVSGELRGDLYRQGREIAFFYPDDPEGFIPNAPFAWGPQPYKGHIFVADYNSGLWALKLRPYGEDEERPEKGEPQ